MLHLEEFISVLASVLSPGVFLLWLPLWWHFWGLECLKDFFYCTYIDKSQFCRILFYRMCIQMSCLLTYWRLYFMLDQGLLNFYYLWSEFSLWMVLEFFVPLNFLNFTVICLNKHFYFLYCLALLSTFNLISSSWSDSRQFFPWYLQTFSIIIFPYVLQLLLFIWWSFYRSHDS